MRRCGVVAGPAAVAAVVLPMLVGVAGPAQAQAGRPPTAPSAAELLVELQSAARYAQAMLAGGLIDPPERGYGPFPSAGDPDPGPSLAYVSGGWSDSRSSFCFDGRARVAGKAAWFRVDDSGRAAVRGRCPADALALPPAADAGLRLGSVR